MDKKNSTENFLNSSSLHGLTFIGASKSLWGRIFWSLVVISAIIGLCFELYAVVSGFISYPTATRISKVVPNEPLAFPDVTICNANSLNSTYLRLHNISKDLGTYLHYALEHNFEEYGQYLNRNVILEEQYQSLLQQHYNSNIQTFMLAAGTQCESFFSECFFDIYTMFDCCKLSRPAMMPTRGSCFLFQGAMLGHQKLSGDGGLGLLIELEKDDVSMGIFPTSPAGLTVKIERQYDPTNREEIFVPLNSETNIGLKLEKTILTNFWLKKESCFQDSPYPWRSTCARSCLTNHMAENYGCVLWLVDNGTSYYDHQGSLESAKSYTRTCSPLEGYEHFTETSDVFNRQEKTCRENCMDPCEQTEFRVQVSSMTFGYDEEYRQRENKTSSPILLHIFYQSFHVTVTEEFVTMTFASVIANVGGAMGVFIGASMISLVEVVGFLARNCLSWFRKQ